MGWKYFWRSIILIYHLRYHLTRKFWILKNFFLGYIANNLWNETSFIHLLRMGSNLRDLFLFQTIQLDALTIWRAQNRNAPLENILPHCVYYSIGMLAARLSKNPLIPQSPCLPSKLLAWNPLLLPACQPVYQYCAQYAIFTWFYLKILIPNYI